MKIIDKGFYYGKLIRSYERGSLLDYRDWRLAYLNKPGLIHYFKIEGYSSKKDDFDMVAIYINDPENMNQPFLKTSEVESITINKDSIKVTTLNSVYEFVLGDFDISEEDKVDLMINRIFKDIENE